MGLRGTEARLPPGFRFHPTDEELICHYLHRKINSNSQTDHDHHQGDTMVEVDLHTCEPWNLPVEAKLGSNEWYFFSFRDRKYATGLRTNRATTHGYWKATGKDKMVVDPGGSNSIVGMRKTLVFYRGRAPKGIKSRWVMHEFRRENPYAPSQEDWVLCRVFYQTRGESNASIASKEHDHDHGHDNDPNHNIIDDTFIFDQPGQYFNMMQPSHVHHGHFGQTSSFPLFSYHGSSSATPHNIDNMRLECESLPSLVDHEEDNSLGFLNEDWKGKGYC